MKSWIVSILVLVAGCATPTEELISEAHKCVDQYADANGVITSAPDEVREACWAPVNARQEAKLRYEKKQREKAAGSCPSGMISVCNGWGDCGCIRRDEMRQIFGIIL